jgi:peptidoglycan/xylan/chitin deacetylase (PgdA/CDA1 family)
MRLAGKKVIYPFYHHIITPEKDQLTRHIYRTKNEAEFRKDLSYFKKNFKSISLNELQEPKTNELCFLLSFDDGLSNFYHVVAPILIEENIRAVNFINTDFVGNRALFFRYKMNLLIEKFQQNTLSSEQKINIQNILGLKLISIQTVTSALNEVKDHKNPIMDELCEILNIDVKAFLKSEQPYLTHEQIRLLRQKGFTFGAHSKSHPYYSELALEEQIYQTQESLNYLQKEFDIQAPAFAFPFSDDGVSQKFFQEFPNMISFGTAGIKDEELGIENIQRIPMEHQSVFSAETIVKGELIFYVLKRLLGKHKIVRKTG